MLCVLSLAHSSPGPEYSPTPSFRKPNGSPGSFSHILRGAPCSWWIIASSLVSIPMSLMESLRSLQLQRCCYTMPRMCGSLLPLAIQVSSWAGGEAWQEWGRVQLSYWQTLMDASLPTDLSYS